MNDNDEKNFSFDGDSGNNESSSRPSGAVDLYFQPVEEGDDDELKNLAENPRALTEDFKEEGSIDAVVASGHEGPRAPRPPPSRHLPAPAPPAGLPARLMLGAGIPHD